MRFTALIGALVLGLLVQLPSFAAEKEGKKKKMGLPAPLAEVKEKSSSFNLNDEQKKKLESILNDYATKFDTVTKKMEGNLTPEQQKTMADARKQAKGDGKKGKDFREAVESSVTLTDAQKAERDAGVKEHKELLAELRKSLSSVLSEEQVNQVVPEHKKKGK